ncbi:hypothetical protein GCM10010307_19200 [Streptomyces vastus]|uniref:Uncharacterized protein n=1 Tax=Streptomyces vastus TaxID=285451 RepID=A0ABN3QKT9_9ACTN
MRYGPTCRGSLLSNGCAMGPPDPAGGSRPPDVCPVHDVRQAQNTHLTVRSDAGGVRGGSTARGTPLLLKS